MSTRMKRRNYTAAEDAFLREHYPHRRTDDIARELGRIVSSVYARAAMLGLHKTAEFLASGACGRIKRGENRSPATCFRPGQVPPNKGLRRPGWAPGRMASTQFKKGQMTGAAQHNYKPIGSLRVSKDGYLERKVTDDPALYPARRWVAVHRLVWQAAHGPIPPGHNVQFRPRCRTLELDQITVDKLELISRAEACRRQGIHNYPQPIPQLMQLRGALTRKIRNRSRSA